MPDPTFADPEGKISRNRDQFLRELLRELAFVLENRIGVDDAKGFIARVGTRIGEKMDAEYRDLLEVERLDAKQVAAALVDLKKRIEGGFEIESIAEDRIVLVNDACPFGSYVKGRQSLCMMTSSVFGRITANNLGYARVEKAETIARGDPRCRIIVHLSEGRVGREYFG